MVIRCVLFKLWWGGESQMNFFWTLYIVLTFDDSTDTKYIEIESFEKRLQCVEAITARVVEVDHKYRFEFKCHKSDEAVR